MRKELFIVVPLCGVAALLTWLIPAQIAKSRRTQAIYNGHQLQLGLHVFRWEKGTYPASAEQASHLDVLSRLVNPYSGNLCRIVPLTRPSDGDFSYVPRMEHGIGPDEERMVVEDFLLVLHGVKPASMNGALPSRPSPLEFLLAQLPEVLHFDSGYGSKRVRAAGWTYHIEPWSAALRRAGYSDLAAQVAEFEDEIEFHRRTGARKVDPSE